MKRPAGDSGGCLGWQGFTIPLPDEWSLAAFSGEWTSGYLRAEGPDDAALELKWKHDKASPSLKGVLKSYVKQLHKAAGRRGPEVEIKEKPRALPSVPQGSGVSQTFSWRSKVSGVGAVWHCLECRRIVLVQVTSPQQAVADSLARRIIPQIADHPEGGVCRWSVYGFAFEAPEAYRLEKQSLRSGHLSIELLQKRRRLIVERYGPASVLLKRDMLGDWATAVKPIFDRIKPFAYRKTLEPAPGQPVPDGEVREPAHDGVDGPGSGADHEVVRLKGRRRGVREIAYRAALWLIRKQAPDALDARVWHCPESNRIYMVMAEAAPTDAEALARQVAASVRCHDTND